MNIFQRHYIQVLRIAHRALGREILRMTGLHPGEGGAPQGGRPRDDVRPVADLIVKLQAELGRRPSSNETYAAGRSAWGHGPRRDKVRRAWELLKVGR